MLENEQSTDNDTAEVESSEDQFDTLEDAMDALGDDELDDEQTDLEDGDSEADDEESSEADDETEADDDFEDGDDVHINLDGEEVTLGELKKGYFRQKDYTHKTEKLAQESKSVNELRDNYAQHSQKLQRMYQNLTNRLEGLIPAEPDIALAQTDPGEYQYQLAIRNQSIAEMQEIFAESGDTDASIQAVNQEEIARITSAEEAKLLEAMPMLKDPGRKAAFDEAVKKTAQEFGFSDDEISTTVDSRVLQVLHYAKIGKIAEQNRKNASRRVAEKPNKGKRPAPSAGKPSKNRQAMKRLNKSGDIEDAMSVDFD